MENRVLFCSIWVNGYHRTKPCTFWQKSILRGKSENHGTKVEGEYTFSYNTITQRKSLIFKYLFCHRNGIQDFGEASIWDALQEYLNDFFRSNSYI